jgi:murein DD-endopeptidase MepM/ murein hydrolase activator NlpD
MRLFFILFFSLLFHLSTASVSSYGLEPKDDEKKKSTSQKAQNNPDQQQEEEIELSDEKDDLEEEEEEDFDLEQEEEQEDIDSLSGFNFLKQKSWTINDSIFNIPAYDVYCNWNTKVIHPYKFDLTKKADTSFIFLQHHTCDYDHPFEGEVTSDFGPRNGRFHYGVDIKLNTGDTVVAAFEGTVRIAQISSTYGNVVVLRHSNGLETFYAHLDKMLVEVGDHLNAGDVLGLGGNTGRSFGSHLHFEVRFMGAPINPNDIISFNDFSLKTNILPLNQSHFAYLTKARAEAKVKSKKSKRKKYYLVKKGDTLSKIARKHGLSAKKLSKINRIKLTSKLRPGRKIKLS